MSKKTLLIVGHVPSPNTQRLRDAVRAGAKSLGAKDISVRVQSPFETIADDILNADAVVLGTTENLGSMAGAMKDFFDRCYYGVLEEKQGMPFALYIRAGMDGTGTQRGVDTILTGLRWRAVNEPLILKGNWDEGFIEQCHELGMLMAAGLEAGVF
jgi:multimeric flavodoxin WrbA